MVGGCNRNELPRVIVEGMVTYEGQPIQEGMILFYPVEGTAGPVSSARIMAGRYSLSNKDGVPLGKHRVVIEGYKAPSPDAHPDAGPVQYLPSLFNRDSQLIAEISGGTSLVEKDFSLAEPSQL